MKQLPAIALQSKRRAQKNFNALLGVAIFVSGSLILKCR